MNRITRLILLFAVIIVTCSWARAQQSYIGAGALSTWNRDHTAAGVFIAGAVSFPSGSIGDFNLNGVFYHESFNEGGAKPAIDARLRYLPPVKSSVRPFLAIGLTTRRVGPDAQWWPTFGGGFTFAERYSVYGDYFVGDPDGGRPHAWRYGAQGLLPLGRANKFNLILFGDATKTRGQPSQYRAGAGIGYEFQ